MTAIQISVFLENKSGRLAELTKVLAKSEINIRALSLAETIDYGVLRLIVNKPSEAKEALMKGGFTVTETAVIAVEMPDQPGALAEVVALLAREGMNIEYLYAYVEKRADNAVVIFRIENVEGALAVLKKGNVRVLSSSEAGSV